MRLNLPVPEEVFLAEYWQRRPLLIREALPGYDPISGDDLAALAMQADLPSRLVTGRQGRRFTLRLGPFPAETYAGLGERDWTLLVQDVDRADPDVAALRHAVPFLPDWRIDDVMVSFAAPGGSVGAHVDHYDVFLVQGRGRRRWRWDASPAPRLACLARTPLRLLKHFRPTDEAVLEAGDALYLPPGVPHHGVALDPCVTLSLGFRAPSAAEWLAALAEDACERLDPGMRFRDADRRPIPLPGHFDPTSVAGFRALLQSALSNYDDDTLASVAGRFLSRYRLAREPGPARAPEASAVLRALGEGRRLVLARYTRPLWRGDGERVRLYLGGREWEVPRHWAVSLCSAEALCLPNSACVADSDLETIRQLLAAGLLRLRR